VSTILQPHEPRSDCLLVHSDSFTISDIDSTTGTQATKVATLSTYACEKSADKHMPKKRLEMKTPILKRRRPRAQTSYHALMHYWKSTPDGEANPSEPLWSFHLNLSSGADVNMLTNRMPRALSTHRLCFKTLRSLLTVAPSCFRTCRVLAAPTVPWPSGPIYKPQGGM
jgi:hypothetical protein